MKTYTWKQYEKLQYLYSTNVSWTTGKDYVINFNLWTIVQHPLHPPPPHTNYMHLIGTEKMIPELRKVLHYPLTGS